MRLRKAYKILRNLKRDYPHVRYRDSQVVGAIKRIYKHSGIKVSSNIRAFMYDFGSTN